MPSHVESKFVRNTLYYTAVVCLAIYKHVCAVICSECTREGIIFAIGERRAKVSYKVRVYDKYCTDDTKMCVRRTRCMTEITDKQTRSQTTLNMQGEGSTYEEIVRDTARDKRLASSGSRIEL